ncbi:MAG: HlyD family efflux transporter periplasmic adaptor subunit, partial [Planctomycetia bacterium]|nr:HlyD family efflux transporter periplasmic adaptor subunit [Planctomycetia bacterium]
MSTESTKQFEIPPVSQEDMVSVEASRERFRRFVIFGGCFVLVFLIGVFISRCTRRSGDTTKVITVRTTRVPFVHEVVGRGNVESSSNVSIVSEVEGKTTIVSLVPEGSWVKAGDVIAQLDPQTIETRMEMFQMWKESAPLELQNMRATFQENEALLEEYLCGTVKAKQMEIEYTIAKTRNSLVESSRLAKSSEQLVRSGYTTDTQLEVDRIAVRKNANSLKKSILDRDVLLHYSSEKQIVDLISKAEAARSSFIGASDDFVFVIGVLKRLEEQFNACAVRAPRDGRVVYANQRLRPGMTESEIIQEGASVRKGQVMFRIPDPNQMQVRALVNENAILRVKEGMKVVLVFDVLRKRSFEGVVVKVNHFPELIPWDTRKRFAVLTEIKNPELIRQAGVDLRSGLSADVRIVVQERRDSVIVPLHALIASGDKQYCLTRRLGVWHAQEVLVEGTNASQASVIDGLKGGEKIVAGAKRYIDRVTLPAPEAPSVFGDRLKNLTSPVALPPKKAQNKNGAAPKENGSNGKNESGNSAPENSRDANGPPGNASSDNPSE